MHEVSALEHLAPNRIRTRPPVHVNLVRTMRYDIFHVRYSQSENFERREHNSVRRTSRRVLLVHADRSHGIAQTHQCRRNSRLLNMGGFAIAYRRVDVKMPRRILSRSFVLILNSISSKGAVISAVVIHAENKLQFG